MATKTVKLDLNGSATIGDLKVSFVGSAPVHFGGGMPPDGSVLFDAELDGECQRVRVVGEDEFAASHDAPGGHTIKVVSPYTNSKIEQVEIEVAAP